MGIQLIDPNEEIRKYIKGQANLPYPTDINKGPVIVPPEDLVMYVDLEVILPGRSVIVDDSASQNQKRSHIGFVVPKKGQLPGRDETERNQKPYSPDDNYGGLGTSWTNIGGLSGFMKNKDNSYVNQDEFGSFQKSGDWNETFGITDISIKLNASFEPQVFINFVDIRGATLMEPGLNSPYAAFFHMPYPLFTLTVKGFYGQGISYKLHLMKFNSKFDAETGNFNISCEFIGFTFTYLADIPAIYADVGPDMMVHYHGVGGGKDPAKPWPEGSMTLGTYISNIADMATKMDAYAEDAETIEYNDMNFALDSLRVIRGHWSLVISDLLESGGEKTYTYSEEEKKITVSACVVEPSSTDPTKDVNGDPIPTGEHPDLLITSGTKRAENANDAYRKLYIAFEGHDQKVQDNARVQELNGTNAMKVYATDVFDEIAETTAISKLQDKNYPSINDISTSAYAGSLPCDKNLDGTIADDEKTSCWGCVQVDGKKFLLDLDKTIKKAELLLAQLKKKKLESENDIKLGALVMPPTLENIFKMLCNGVGGFNWSLNNVSELADTQHQEDPYLKDLLLKNPTTGSDIKENAERIFSWPLVYKTKEDRVDKEVNTGIIKKQNVTRFEKVFPGAKISQDIYEYPEYTTDPYFWPEIGFIELLINTIIKKTKLLNVEWNPDDNEFSSQGESYIPAIIEETPGVTNPYKGLEDVKLQIIPLMALRTLLRLGHSNHFMMEDEEKISILGDTLASSIEIYGPKFTKTKRDEAIKILGEAEAEALIVGVQDSNETKERLRELFTVLTGELRESNDGSAKVARKKAMELLKKAGYKTGEVTGEKVYYTRGGSNDDIVQNEDGTVEKGTYSFYGTQGKLSGKQITRDGGYYLPNVLEELSTNIFFHPCGTEAGANTNMTTCPGFFISDVSSYEINASVISPEQEKTLEKEKSAMEDYYESGYGVSEYSPSIKLYVGPQGTLDYDWKKWLGWDFYSFWSADNYKEEVKNGRNNNDTTGKNHITPDQWISLSVIYSDPTKIMNIGGGGDYLQTPSGPTFKNCYNSDSQVLLMEDSLFIKNDVDSNNPNYNYDAIAPYSTAADTDGYLKAKVGNGSGVVDKKKASNLALGYLFINSVGKYYSTRPMYHFSDNHYADMWNILKMFNQVSGYVTLPQSVILQMGSWIYRYEETEDIIKWPNYFSAEGTKTTTGINYYKIPTKGERPMPESSFYAEGDVGGNIWAGTKWAQNGTNAGRQSCREVKHKYINNWHLTNKLHFIHKPKGWSHDTGGSSTTAGTVKYDDITKAIGNLPEYIKSQLKEFFIQWALGETIMENDVYSLEPSFPTIKESLLEETVIENLHGKTGKCAVQGFPTYGTLASNNDAQPLGQIFPTNLLPSTRLWTSYCANNTLTGYGKSDHETLGGHGIQFNRGICPLYHEAPAMYGQAQAWLPGSENINGNGVVTFVTRELTEEYKDNKGRYVVKPFALANTWTQPLLFNGYTNWQINHQAEQTKVQKFFRRGFGWMDSIFGTGELLTIVDYDTAINYYSKIQHEDENDDPVLVKTLYDYAMGLQKYYFVRKVSHTNDVIAFASRAPYKSQTRNGVTTINNAVDGFPLGGSSVYKNIQYMNPISAQWGPDKKEDEVYAIANLYDLGDGFWNWFEPEVTAKPTFYVPKYFQDANSTDKTNEVIENELWLNLRTMMSNNVVVKNPTWRNWMGMDENAMNGAGDTARDLVYTNEELLDVFYGALIKRIETYVNEGGLAQTITAKAKMEDILNDNDIKLDTYLTVKNLHDKWMTPSASAMKTNNLSYSGEDATKIDWLFSQFSFVDRAYNWIGQKYIDPTPLLNLKNNPKISLYTLIYDLISHNSFEFFPLPSNIEFADDNAFSKMFTPHLTVDGDAVSKNPRFYIMYMGGFSDSLDIDSPDYQFNNDGFDIDDECIDCPPDYFGAKQRVAHLGALSSGVLLVSGQAKSVGGTGYQPGVMIDAPVIIPQAGTWECHNPAGGTCEIRQQEVRAFKVAFGQENQNFFKSINVDQAEFQETQESLLLIDALSKEESTTKDPRLKGQNLYNVYQKRSYSCSVEALGMMNILPLQYFQLDHVPMFHGAYIITNVEHSISPGEINTTFKGTRISRSVIPYVSSFLAKTSDYESGTSSGGVNFEYDPDSTTVLSGDVERIGVWMDKSVGDTQVKTLQNYGMNSIVFELNASWPEGKSNEKDRWKGAEWRWQPVKSASSPKTHTPNAKYTLAGLQEACKKAYDANQRITWMLYFVPTKAYMEPMVDGTGVETYDSKTDWYDWAGEGLDKPPTLPELVQKVNTYCGGVCVHAVEFDLEGHYRKTHWSTTKSKYVSGPYLLGYTNNIKKKDLARKLIDKLREQFKTRAGSTEIGTTPYVGTSYSLKDTSSDTKTAKGQYWQDPAHPEFGAIVDYMAVQSYSHPKFLLDYRKKVNGKDNPRYKLVRHCENHSDCPYKGDGGGKQYFCQGGDDPTGGVYAGEPRPGEWITVKCCQSITYAWPQPGYTGGDLTGYQGKPRDHGYAGPGARAKYSGKTVKGVAESGFNGGTGTGKDPYYICGAAGYDQKFNYHTIQEALTASWNGCLQPITGNSYKPKEIRYWSYQNVFGRRGFYKNGEGPIATFIKDQASKKKAS